MKIENGTLNVLADLAIDGNKVFIEAQLPRPLYVKVDKVLQACGGKWSRSARAHVFTDADPAALLEKVVATGEITTNADLGFFPTPSALVDRMLDLAKVGSGTLMLEPSAGEGAIAKPAFYRGAEIVCFEIDDGRANLLGDRLRAADLDAGGGLFTVAQNDFLKMTPQSDFDAVVMNPPFAKQQDIDHVVHAFKFLKPGGRLVAIMGAGVTFRTNRKTVAFRAFVAQAGGTIEPLPEGTFKVSGTAVNTVLVVLDK